MRIGVRLGIDVGKARIGVARSDPHGLLAVPLETLRRDAAQATDIARIGELAAEFEILEAVVGLPINLQGKRTPSTDDAEAFADALTRAGVRVRLLDERLSTVSAQSQLHAVGRNTKQSKSVIDQAAAVVILQHALDSERASGQAPGRIAETRETGHPPHRNEAT